MVAELPDPQASVIRLRHGLDRPALSPEATAKALGLTVSAVNAIEAEGLACLRRRLDDLDYPLTFTEESPMADSSRLNGFLIEPSSNGTAAHVEVDPKKCPNCHRSFKNPLVKRCYYRDCDGYAGGVREAKAKAAGKGKATKAPNFRKELRKFPEADSPSGDLPSPALPSPAPDVA